MVFTKTKRGANRLTEKLIRRGVNAAAIHGNKSQQARERALAAFRSKRINVLVATDVAARGIDIDDVDRKHTWVNDATECLKPDKEGFIHSHAAKSILAHALTVFKTKKGLWLRAAELVRDLAALEGLQRVTISHGEEGEV